MPWVDPIKKREGAFDAALQPKIDELRIRYFYAEEFPNPPGTERPC